MGSMVPDVAPDPLRDRVGRGVDDDPGPVSPRQSGDPAGDVGGDVLVG